jgi:hypothetical protein
MRPKRGGPLYHGDKGFLLFFLLFSGKIRLPLPSERERMLRPEPQARMDLV